MQEFAAMCCRSTKLRTKFATIQGGLSDDNFPIDLRYFRAILEQVWAISMDQVIAAPPTREATGTTEERFLASPAYALEVLAFEGELRGERSPLPDGQESVQTVAVTQAVLQSIEERRMVAVPAMTSSRLNA